MAADFVDGVAAYKVGDYEAAIGEFMPLAVLGNVAAQNTLALMYANGYGVPQDHKEAVNW